MVHGFSFRHVYVWPIAVVCAMVVNVDPISAQVVYRVTGLNPIAGFVQSEATSINDRGDIVGSSFPQTINWNGTATRWTAGRPSSLGRVKNGTFSSADSINKTGFVVGTGDSGRPNAVAYSKTGGVFLTKGANNSFAIFVDDAGLIYGNLLKGFDSNFLPVVWRPNPKKIGEYTYSELVHFDSAGLQAEANLLAANNMGEAVGYAFDSQLGQVPVLWDESSRVGIQLPGQPSSLPLGINDNGVIVGMGMTPNSHFTAIVWSPSPELALTELPLFAGETAGSASGINNAGTIIGYHTDRPAVWINGQIHDVNASLDSTGQGWVIEKLNDINNLGVIVGSGLRNGVRRAVVLTPVP